MHAPPPTARLLRAAAAERDEIARHRTRLAEEADELRRALARIERGLLELDERRALLDRLAPEKPAAAAGEGARGGAAGGAARGEARRDAPGGGAGRDAATADGCRGAAGGGGDPGRTLLRGPEIREVAVRVLRDGGGEALHYRDWFALLGDAGHEVAGKDPLAVFLTQLGRSPAVRRGATAGVYELDRHAGARLRARREALQRELRELTVSPRTDLTDIRSARERLNADIGRVERALEEIARVLGPGPPLAAAG